MDNIKSIVLKKNEWFTLKESQFYHATNGKKANQITEVKLKADDRFLYIEFVCKNNPFVNQNSYLEHNSEMWNQEVFELFIANGDKTPKKYLEIEINPNNALFVAWVENKTGERPDSLLFIDHTNAGILHGVQKSTDSWNGFMHIPIGLMTNKSDVYRLNFYRVVSKESNKNPNWKCNLENSDFICWSPTHSGTDPRFHRPEAFGLLTIEK
jgi:Carbohydrate-binding family 9